MTLDEIKSLSDDEIRVKVAELWRLADALYDRVEYYREYAPHMLRMSPQSYAETMEAKLTDQALEAFRKETGAVKTYNTVTKEGVR